ncbi:anthranilate synthase component I [Candidatus Saganbacteria bacterium CG08_land_8_20_14_0_20_45_16]|uniref:Anthranilate synthase component 1 n=1 Tax=Candidatus Saganbacteria bacterium CG08_land_8_20_14_0_20_45_16 TaxID=2014293 RepID=A0A2H0XZK8_UNCSA|nr:MAG: anthranilate synthase component I [Candidatus Saganbacteria bacterium CG08_land_8_20_14_0_20_45_16]
MFNLTAKEFVNLAKKYNLVPVYKELDIGEHSPVEAFAKIAGENSFLLESVAGSEKIARFSFLGTVAKDKVKKLSRFSQIKKLLAEYNQPAPVKGLPRFHGGLVGYVSYDMVREIESLPSKNPDPLALPPMVFLAAETLLAFDHVRGKLLIIANAKADKNPEKAYDLACQNISRLEKMLQKPVELSELKEQLAALSFRSNFSQKQFEAVVSKGKEYIKAGDIIQFVPSQRLEITTTANPFNVYRVLRQMNPSPYMYYLKLGKLEIVGTSPEVMVRLENGEATVRPIAGTRRRGQGPAEDLVMEKELLACPKEVAEHVMLVDLGRNDLGRVCEYGSVKVTEQLVVERYSHVMHIVSNVTGQLRSGLDAVDLLKATFPAGTVSGAPKVRAMEIIDELENRKRGLYAGCIGYFGFSGEMDTCITIRTIVFKGDQAYVQVGAGIVADSNPTEEYKETMNKAKAMLRSIELAS